MLKLCPIIAQANHLFGVRMAGYWFEFFFIDPDAVGRPNIHDIEKSSGLVFDAGMIAETRLPGSTMSPIRVTPNTHPCFVKRRGDHRVNFT